MTIMQQTNLEAAAISQEANVKAAATSQGTAAATFVESNGHRKSKAGTGKGRTRLQARGAAAGVQAHFPGTL